MSDADPFGLNTLALSGVMMQIWSPKMFDGSIDKQDIHVYLQLGLCVAQDKPLILICKPGDQETISKSMRKVASYIIEMDKQGEWQDLLVQALLECGMESDRLREWVDRFNH